MPTVAGFWLAVPEEVDSGNGKAAVGLRDVAPLTTICKHHPRKRVSAVCNARCAGGRVGIDRKICGSGDRSFPNDPDTQNIHLKQTGCSIQQGRRAQLGSETVGRRMVVRGTV